MLMLSFRWEWPSGLRRCKNRKVPGSNPTRRSAGLRDPTSLRGSRWHSGQKCKTQWLTSGEWGCPLDNGPIIYILQFFLQMTASLWPQDVINMQVTQWNLETSYHAPHVYQTMCVLRYPKVSLPIHWKGK